MATIRIPEITIGGDSLPPLSLPQQFNDLTASQLSDIQNKLGVSEADFDKQIAQSQADLYSRTAELEAYAKSTRADLDLFELGQLNLREKTNLALGSLTNNYEQEREERDLGFQKKMQEYQFAQEKQNIQFGSNLGDLKDNQKLKNLGFNRDLKLLGLKEGEIKNLEDYRSKKFKDDQAFLNEQLGDFRGLESSLRRSQGILDQRLGLVDDIRDLDIEANENLQGHQRRLLRGSVFQSQNFLAKDRAVRRVFGFSQGAIFGTSDLDRKSEQAGRKISQLTTSLKNTKIGKEKIIKTSIDRKLGIKGQKESLKRQQLKLKNSERKVEKALKDNNNLRDYQKKGAEFALKEVGVRKDFIGEAKTLAGITTKRKIDETKSLHSLVNRAMDFNRKMTQSLYVLKNVRGEKTFNLNNAKELNDFASSRDQANLERQQQVVEQNREMEKQRRARNKRYYLNMKLLEQKQKIGQQAYEAKSGTSGESFGPLEIL